VAASLTLTPDQDNYNIGDQIVITAVYSNETASPYTLVITGEFTDPATSDTVKATTAVTVATTAQAPMTGRVTDSWGDSYTELDNDHGIAHYSAILAQPQAVPGGRS
jgi:hypothetical protein